MTAHRENLLRSLRRQGFEWVPCHPGGFCPSQVEAFQCRFGHRDYVGYFNAPCRTFYVGLEKTWTDARALYPREELPAGTEIDPLGIGHSNSRDSLHMTRLHHPLRGEDVTLEEIRNHPLPRVAAESVERVRHMLADCLAKGLAVAIGQESTLWETAWKLRSMEDIMADMMMEEERAVVLLDRIEHLAIEQARVAAGTGCDILRLGDDIGMQQTTMMSVELWRMWLKPRLARIIVAAREIKPDLLIFYHSCGYVLPFLEDLIEVGVDILNPVQPECMSFSEVHAKVGGRISFWGTVGTQTTLPFGTPDDVRQAVWENLRICGAQGGIVISPTHVVEPEVPWENLLAIKEACETFKESAR